MDLSGVTAHDPAAVTDEPREAAVIAPVIEDGRDGRDGQILFVKRADHLGEHPGQMAFPGGGREPSDASLRATAIREAGEEIGLRPAEAEIVGRIDDIRTVTRYSVRPFVAHIPDRAYEPDGREVTDIAKLAVEDLTERSNYESERRDHPHYGTVRLHFFHVDGYTVWGATARMLVQLLELTTDWSPPDEVDRVVDRDADQS